MNGFSKIACSLAIVMLMSACNASVGSSNVPSTNTIGAAMRSSAHARPHGAAVPACAGSRVERVQCDVLVRTGTDPNVSGYGPTDLEAAYNLPSSSEGSGQVVAIVEAYDNPNVTSNLAVYRSYFGLGTASFTKYNQTGQTKNYPIGNTGWGIEIDLDVEMVSASCPLCTIYLVEANSNTASDVQTAEAEKVRKKPVSLTWGSASR